MTPESYMLFHMALLLQFPGFQFRFNFVGRAKFRPVAEMLPVSEWPYPFNPHERFVSSFSLHGNPHSYSLQQGCLPSSGAINKPKLFSQHPHVKLMDW